MNARFFSVSTCLFGFVLGLAVGCTLVTAPNDEVERCSNVDDCDAPDDKRFAAVCEDPEPGVDGVCVATSRDDVGCDPESYPLESPFRTAWEEAQKPQRSYVQDCTMHAGEQGCGPNGGACNAGLAVNQHGVCDDGDPSTPSAVPASGGLRGVDVLDQFCRSFFCDNTYVCNPTSKKCERCRTGQPVGEGGCGTIYWNGAPMCPYELAVAEDAPGSKCPAPNSSTNDPIFGAC